MSARDVRTSESHPIQVNWLPAEASSVGLTFAPGKKGRSRFGYTWDRSLDADLTALIREHRIHTLVTLMEEHELMASQVPQLLTEAARQGIETIHFPIPDVRAPRDVHEVDDVLAKIEARLTRGHRVAVHCLGGIGRTGTIATCLLLRRGTPLADAIKIVQDTRCTSFPESREQEEFVTSYARHVARRRPAPRQAASAPSRAGLPWGLLGWAPPATTAMSKRDVCTLLGTIERQVKASPQARFALDAEGTATLQVDARSYHAGRFEVPSIQSLEQRARDRGRAAGSIRLSILGGVDPMTDIGALQASSPAGTLFQVASQFNCLEATGAHMAQIQDYPHDNTQGPRASVSAFPGTFLRHYFAPREAGGRFVQSDRDALNLLGDVLDPRVAQVRSGYLTSDGILDAKQLARALEDRFGEIRVGLHDDVEVVLGADWGGAVPNAPKQRIAQAFTSTIALGGYSRDDGSREIGIVRQQLLRAAYHGTLLGALALGKQTVVLTLIGGGAFGNAHRAIWDAIHWAVAEAAKLGGGLEVIVNAHGDKVEPADIERARASGGTVIDVKKGELRASRALP